MKFKKKLYKHFRTKICDIYDPRIRVDFFCVFYLFQENVKELRFYQMVQYEKENVRLRSILVPVFS